MHSLSVLQCSRTHEPSALHLPDIRKLKKKDLGLPHVSDATDEQKSTGMCWESEDELYNNGTPFKITLRDKRGIMVTILADNYFGYCKKEVKTQIGLTANIFGLAEEEHAGGEYISLTRHSFVTYILF